MKSVINKDKIIKADIMPEIKYDGKVPVWEELPWRVVLLVGFNEYGTNTITVNKNNEQECIDFVKSLGFLELE